MAGEPMSAPDPATKGRIGDLPGLDALRAVAVLLVMVFHAPALLPMNYVTALERWSRGAWVGVDLFFVLSGFLVTGTLLKGRASEGLSAFWIRRALRIMPLYFLYVGVLLILQGHRDAWDISARLINIRDDDVPRVLCFLGNVPEAIGHYPGMAAAILWSIAIEEHFYLLWPFAARGLSPRGLQRLCVAIVALSPLLRWVALPYAGENGVYLLTPFRLDGLAVGAWLAVQATSAPAWDRVRAVAARWSAVALAAFAAFVATPFGIWEPARGGAVFSALGYTVIALCGGVFVVVAADPQGLLRSVCARPLVRHIGRVSYGMYIWHVLVGAALAAALRPLAIPRAGLELLVPVWALATLAVASFTFRFFESPVLRLKSRWAPSVGMLGLPHAAEGEAAASPVR
jgi:peptidoglycan/LPS O-acetylase OafA/YrhL